MFVFHLFVKGNHYLDIYQEKNVSMQLIQKVLTIYPLKIANQKMCESRDNQAWKSLEHHENRILLFDICPDCYSVLIRNEPLAVINYTSSFLDWQFIFPLEVRTQLSRRRDSSVGRAVVS